MTNKEKLPVNPATMDKESAGHYFASFKAIRENGDGCPPLFKGTDAFNVLISEEKIGIGAIIKVTNYHLPTDLFFVITKDGLRKLENGKTCSPEEILDAPFIEWWSVVGYNVIKEE